MKKNIISLLLLLAFFAISSAKAQRQYHFSHINTKGYQIRIIEIDKQGIVWFGTTSGLVSMPQLKSRNASIYNRSSEWLNSSISHIWAIDDALMMKNINNDIFVYYPRENRIKTDVTEMLHKKHIYVTKDFTTQMDKNGNGWIVQGNKIYYFTQHFNLRKTISLPIKEDALYNATLGRNNLAAISRKSLYIVSLKDKKITAYVNLPQDFVKTNLVKLMTDGNNNVWIYHHNKMAKYDIKKHAWEPTVHFQYIISGIATDDEGSMWVSTINNGIFIYDKNGTPVTHLRHDAWEPQSLLNNRVDMIQYEEESKTMWVAYSKGGISIYNSLHNNTRINNIVDSDGKHTQDILCFAQSADGNKTWIGCEDNGVFYRAHPNGSWSNILPDVSATALLLGKDGHLWIGLYQRGLINISTNGTTQSCLQGISVYAIAEDRLHNVFVATQGEGVKYVNAKTNEIHDTGLTARWVFDLKLYNDRLYAATSEGFFIRDTDNKWKKIVEGSYKYVLKDSEGYIWLLGGDGYNGITLLDKQNQTVSLPEDFKHSFINCIAADSQRNIWIKSDKELIKASHSKSDNNVIEALSFNIDNLYDNTYYNYRGMYFAHNGDLWFGTSEGYQILDFKYLKSIAQKSKDCNPIIGSISINDIPLSAGMEFNGRTPICSDVIYTKELSLKHNENNIIIECSQPFDSYLKTTVYYQVQGLSNSWHAMKDNAILLSNLPHGDYEIYTRYQSSAPTLLLKIHIAPPFWLSWWAILIYSVLAFSAIYGIARFYYHKHIYRIKLQQMEMQQEKVTQMNEMKLRFFTNISHDLRTPLSLIIGPIEELIDKVRDEDQLTMLRMMQNNANNLLSLVNQILDFRRLEFSHEKLILAYGDIVQHIHDICSSFKLKANKESINLSFTPVVERMETLFDKDKTTKIMMNLLSNAFKYTHAGGSISVGLNISNDKILVDVTDTGTGISEADKPHIFERFFLSSDNNKTAVGSGIGLHIVKEYVQLQGGSITVSDNPSGKGTQFVFSIPIRKKERPDLSSPQKAAPSTDVGQMEPPAEEQLHETTIMLVDDNPDLIEYMRLCLSEYYNIITAANAELAIPLLEENDIDMIISDVMMPGIDGLEFCKRVKTNIATSHIPVMLLTAKTMSSDEMAGLEAGADDYITKPFSVNILRQRIRNIIERSVKQHKRFASEIDISPSEITVTSLDEKFIAHAIEIVEKHIAEPDFSVEELSSEMGVHRSQMYKKLLHITGKSPLEFIRILRLKRGKQLLEQGGLYVSEVAYQVGFNSPRIFSKYFKEEFGITPKTYKK